MVSVSSRRPGAGSSQSDSTLGAAFHTALFVDQFAFMEKLDPIKKMAPGRNRRQQCFMVFRACRGVSVNFPGGMFALKTNIQSRPIVPNAMDVGRFDRRHSRQSAHFSFRINPGFLFMGVWSVSVLADPMCHKPQFSQR